jgi:hypothetical protein
MKYDMNLKKILECSSSGIQYYFNSINVLSIFLFINEMKAYHAVAFRDVMFKLLKCAMQIRARQRELTYYNNVI